MISMILTSDKLEHYEGHITPGDSKLPPIEKMVATIHMLSFAGMSRNDAMRTLGNVMWDIVFGMGNIVKWYDGKFARSIKPATLIFEPPKPRVSFTLNLTEVSEDDID